MAVEHTLKWTLRLRRYARHPACVYRALDVPQYLDGPAEFAPYDLVLIDGIEREACLERAPAYLSDAGVTILHDAGRGYHSFEEHYADTRSFLDYREEGGLWIASKTRPLDELLDMERHEKVWSFYRRFGKQINYLYGPGIFPRGREVL